jgi:hypothetical protein
METSERRAIALALAFMVVAVTAMTLPLMGQ